MWILANDNQIINTDGNNYIWLCGRSIFYYISNGKEFSRFTIFEHKISCTSQEERGRKEVTKKFEYLKKILNVLDLNNVSSFNDSSEKEDSKIIDDLRRIVK